MKTNSILSIYSFTSYKKYLEYILELNKDKHGYQSRLAKAAGCLPSYFSQVINSTNHLNHDHLYNLGKYFNFSDHETFYLFDLLNYERSGTDDLKKYYKKKIDDLQKKNRNLGERFKDKKVQTLEEQSIYFSHWMMGAIYALCMLKGKKNIQTIAAKLDCTTNDVIQYISKLEKIGLIHKEGDEYVSGVINIHLGEESPFLPQFHRNWREKAIEDAIKNSEGTHYTSLYMMSEEATKNLRVKIVEWIEESRKFAATSNPENITCFNIDFFKVTK